jgi:hypothetical protein
MLAEAQTALNVDSGLVLVDVLKSAKTIRTVISGMVKMYSEPVEPPGQQLVQVDPDG